MLPLRGSLNANVLLSSQNFLNDCLFSAYGTDTHKWRTNLLSHHFLLASIPLHANTAQVISGNTRLSLLTLHSQPGLPSSLLSISTETQSWVISYWSFFPLRVSEVFFHGILKTPMKIWITELIILGLFFKVFIEFVRALLLLFMFWFFGTIHMGS